MMKKLLLLLLLIPIVSFGQKQNLSFFNGFDKIFVGVKDDFGNVKNDVESALRTAGMEINDDINSFDCKSVTIQLITSKSPNALNCGKMGIKLLDCNNNVVTEIRDIKTINSMCNPPYDCCYYNYGRAFSKYLNKNKFRYSYNPSMNNIQDESNVALLDSEKFDSKSEISLRKYFDENKINSIEGIWEYASNDNTSYKLAITKKDYKFYASIIEGGGRWNPGEIKAEIEPSASSSIMTIRWTMGDRKTIVKSIAKVTNDALMEFELKHPDEEDNSSKNSSKTMLYKVYPQFKENSKKTVLKKGEWAGNGSGIIISKSGYIATNHHVIEDADKIEVEFNYEGEKTTFNAEIVQIDKTNDLAIIKIFDMKFDGLENIPYNFKTRSSDVGTDVFALGYPKALTSMGTDIKFTDGRISSKSGFQGDITTYQTTTAIQPGNSGGPLFDTNANLIGINSAKIVADDVEGVSYSIKTNYLLNLIDVLPKSITLPNDKSLSANPLTEQIKELSKYTVLIKVK